MKKRQNHGILYPSEQSTRFRRKGKAMNNQQKNKNGARYKTPTWIYVVYVLGITLAVGGYVFTDASGYLIPGLSPLSLAAVIGAFTYDYYQKNKTGNSSLKAQMIILGILIAYNVVIGFLALGAAFFGSV